MRPQLLVGYFAVMKIKRHHQSLNCWVCVEKDVYYVKKFLQYVKRATGHIMSQKLLCDGDKTPSSDSRLVCLCGKRYVLCEKRPVLYEKSDRAHNVCETRCVTEGFDRYVSFLAVWSAVVCVFTFCLFFFFPVLKPKFGR